MPSAPTVKPATGVRRLSLDDGPRFIDLVPVVGARPDTTRVPFRTPA